MWVGTVVPKNVNLMTKSDELLIWPIESKFINLFRGKKFKI
jgi:hypothetical protein